jgi:hypothetical protein
MAHQILPYTFNNFVIGLVTVPMVKLSGDVVFQPSAEESMCKEGQFYEQFSVQLTVIPTVNAQIAVGQRGEHTIVQVQNGIDRADMLYLDFVLLDPNVVGAIVDMDATVLCAQPHGRLLMLRVVGVRILRKINYFLAQISCPPNITNLLLVRWCDCRRYGRR